MYLSSLIKEAYDLNSVIVTYVYGNMGYGKTSYALWTAYEVLGSWDRVLDYVFFDLEEAIEVMWKHIQEEKRLKIVIFDDAGFYLNRLTWWKEEKIRFMELFNLIRTISAGVIFTTPSEELPRQLTSKCNYRVSVRPMEPHEIESETAIQTLNVAAKYKLEDGGVAVAKGYQLVMLPSFMKLVKKEYIDYYPLWYPIFEQYMKLRFKHIKQKIKELKESQSKNREELLEEAIELYKKTQDPKQVYQFLKKRLPQPTAYRWAHYRIPAITNLDQHKNNSSSTLGMNGAHHTDLKTKYTSQV
jgi:hypothetical protein